MQFRCILSFRTRRSKTYSTWRTTVRGPDVTTAAAKAIVALKRRQRRAIEVVGIYVHLREAQEASGGNLRAKKAGQARR